MQKPQGERQERALCASVVPDLSLMTFVHCGQDSVVLMLSPGNVCSKYASYRAPLSPLSLLLLAAGVLPAEPPPAETSFFVDAVPAADDAGPGV